MVTAFLVDTNKNMNNNKLAALAEYTVAVNYTEAVNFAQSHNQTPTSSDAGAVEAAILEAIKADRNAIGDFVQIHPDKDLFDCADCLAHENPSLAATGGLTSLEPTQVDIIDTPTAPPPQTQYFTRERIITLAAVIVALGLAVFLSIRFR